MTKARDIAGFPENLNVGEKTNLLTNGDFTTDTSNWTATTSTLSINSSRLQIIPDASVNGFATQRVDNLVVGRSYIASVDIIQDASTFGRLYIGTTLNGQETVSNVNLGVGSHSFTFTATATTHYFALVVGGGTGQTTIFDNARLTEANTITFPAISGTSPSIRQGTTVNDLAIATNNINRFNITNDGYVTNPYQPAFNAYRTSNQSISGTTTLVFNSVRSNASNSYNSSNGIFTAPVAGQYIFTFKAMFYPFDTSEYLDLYSYVNSSIRNRYEQTGNGGGHTQIDYTEVVYLNANDTFKLVATDRNVGSFGMYPNENHISGRLLG